jgi:hypothetical protein
MSAIADAAREQFVNGGSRLGTSEANISVRDLGADGFAD